ncbi:class I SAM-dependent methyltransferase [Desulfosarcina sp.]|uniref:class I SAM-dependent methyltransferase n=1 Tax=Desulfosarcina sp. TaxID=2027861 RepID=UPI003565E935
MGLYGLLSDGRLSVNGTRRDAGHGRQAGRHPGNGRICRRDVRGFEVDLPATVVRQAELVLAAIGKIPATGVYVPVDYRNDGLDGALESVGYDSKRKTLFVCEGVTRYIDAAAVDRFMRFITGNTAPGSSVVFDYMPLGAVQGDFERCPDIRRLSFWVAYRGKPLVFGIRKGDSAAYVSQHGLKVMSDLAPKDLEKRYLTCSDGSLDGPCASAFRIMHAAAP